MAKLVSIAREHQCVVICSLHAPRSAIFSGIHDLLLLSAGGRVCYSGKAADAGDQTPAVRCMCTCMCMRDVKGSTPVCTCFRPSCAQKPGFDKRERSEFPQ